VFAAIDFRPVLDFLLHLLSQPRHREGLHARSWFVKICTMSGRNTWLGASYSVRQIAPAFSCLALLAFLVLQRCVILLLLIPYASLCQSSC